MSVSCQSWEGGSGPGVGYKIGAKVCQACSDGSNFRHQPESVACGLTSFRIYMPNPDIPKPQCVGQQKDGKPVPTQFGGASQNGVSTSSSYDVLGSAPSNFKVHGFASGSFRCDPIKSVPNIPLVAKDIRSLTNATSAVVGMEQDRFSGDHSSSDRCQVPGPELISNGGLRCGAREESSSSSANSIDEDSNDMEVQSTFHGPLDQMDSLMSSLPIKRGLSKFYIGKSKSFTSLADVKSVKDLPKPDNPYARKRKLLHGQREGFERQRFPPPRTSTVGITKRAVPSSISGLTVALAMCKRGERLDGEDWDLNPPRANSIKGCGRGSIPSRSFSLTDLQKA